MKKVSLLLGTLGGALGAYVLGNKTLRQELSKAKDAEAGAKILGKHLQKDSKKIVKQVQEFVESDDVQKNLEKAKKFTLQKYEEAQKGVKDMMKKSPMSKMTGKSPAKKPAAKKKTPAKKAAPAKTAEA